MHVFSLISFIILESLTELWAVVWRYTWSLVSKYGTTCSKLNFLGCNRWDVGMWERLEASNCMDDLLWEQLKAQDKEKRYISGFGSLGWLFSPLVTCSSCRKYQVVSLWSLVGPTSLSGSQRLGHIIVSLCLMFTLINR